MKIAEVKIGEHYVLNGSWKHERDHVEALGIETTLVGGTRYQPGRNERRVRVRYVEVAPRTWGQTPTVGTEALVKAARLEGGWEEFRVERDRREAEQAKGEAVGARIEAALERLGIEPDVERIRGSVVYLTLPYEDAVKLAAALEPGFVGEPLGPVVNNS